MRKRGMRKLRRLIVPVALGVTVIAGASAVVSSSTGCGHDARPDASLYDATADTPII